MHHSRAGVFVLDCDTDDLSQAARFWGEALGEEIEVDEDGLYARVGSFDRHPRMILQKVSHKSRIHMDIETDDQEAEAARLKALGAVEVSRLKGWIVMEAPTGHRFCLIKPQGPDFEGTAWG